MSKIRCFANRIRNGVIALFLAQGIQAQVVVNCSNLHLSADTFYLSHTQNTSVVGDLHYLDTNMTVYPVLRLILEDTSMITSPNIMVLSFLAYPIDSLEPFIFPIHFKTTNYPSNTVVKGWFHVYDSDMPGDSIVSCYFPIKLILQNPLSVRQRISKSTAHKIYPNPAGNGITISVENKSLENCTFLLFDLSGKLVFEKKEICGQTCQIEIPELENGLYVYTLNDMENVQIRGKMVLAK
jgi:hypothetical protein